MSEFEEIGGTASGGGVVRDFLLGGKTLDRSAVVHLLLSSSFGINALFYAAWLGYSIGAWALVIQASWAASFFLLSGFSERIVAVRSLHEFMGNSFGRSTRIIAAWSSLVGIVYFVGWEVGIGQSAIESFLEQALDYPSAKATSTAEILTIVVVVGVVLYTSIWGLRGNARVDTWLNLLKIVAVVSVVSLVLHRSYTEHPEGLWRAMFPSLGTVVKGIGIFGIITNIAFNLSWQFVDNSSWQSIISGSANRRFSTRNNMRLSGLTIFLTIGFLGTLLGVSHASVGPATPDDILIVSVLGLGGGAGFLATAMVLLVVACMMSLVDGMLLASALTVIVDIFPRGARGSRRTRMVIAHATVLIAAIASVWGISWLFRLWGGSLFDFVYIVIVTQLSLFGPVLVGLFSKGGGRGPMWMAIVGGLLSGFGAVVIGTRLGLAAFVDGAGTLAIVGSLVGAWGVWAWMRRA